MEQMRRKLVLVVLVSLLFSLMVPGFSTVQASGSLPFWDVYGTPYEKAVESLYPLGVAKGITADRFGGQQAVNRGQMAAFSMRALGVGTHPTGPQTPFTDVPIDHWAFGDIQTASTLQVIRGGPDGLFRPDQQVTLGEAVTMLLRALGYEPEIKGPWPVAHIIKAEQLGLLGGMPDFEAYRNATRGEIAILLANAIFRVPLVNSDGKTLSQTKFQVAVSQRISPDVDYLPKGTSTLIAEGLDAAGRGFPLKASFSIRSGSAVITPPGDLTVTGGSTVVVQATIAGNVVYKTYRVLQGLVVEPAGAEGSVNRPLALKALGVTGDGSNLVVEPKWELVSGSGSVSPFGVATPSATGSMVVRARLGDLTAVSSILTGASFTMEQGNVTLTPSATHQFRLSTGGATPPDNVEWRVTGPGSISSSGLFTAGSGNAVVEARVGTLKATATVTVVTSLTVEPASTTLSRTGSQTFTVTAKTGTGQSVPNFATWTVSGGIGVMSGGVLVPTSPGTGEVTAQLGTLSAKAAVTVVGDPVSLRMTADKTSVPANGSTQIKLRAWAADSQGNVVKGAVSKIHFAVSTSTGGSLSSQEVAVLDGVAEVTFTPSRQASSITVYATPETGLLAGTTVALNTYPPVPAKVELSAYPTRIAADASSISTITARLVDSNGVEVTNSTASGVTVNLANTGTIYGTLAATALTILPGASSASTTFRANTALGTARLTGASSYPIVDTAVTTAILGPATKVAISRTLPATAADNVASLTVRVELQDAQGSVRTGDYGVPVYLEYGLVGQAPALSYGTINGGLATFHIQSTLAGTNRLRAYTVTPGILGDEATAEFLPGAPSKLSLTVEPTPTVPADRVSTVTLKATIQDVYGNKVTTANNAVSFSRATTNAGSELVGVTTVNAVGGFATIQVRGTATPATDTYTVTSSGLTSPLPVSITSRIIGVPVRVDVQPVATSRVGEPVAVKVQLKDANGYLASNVSGRTISLTHNSASAVVIPTSAQAVNGEASFTITNTRAETVTLIASSAGLLADTTEQVMFQPGPGQKIRLRSGLDALSADGISQTTIWADLLDAHGNIVSTGVNVTLALSNPAVGRLNSTSVYTNGGTAIFTTTTSPGTTTITGAGAGYVVDPLTIRTAVAGAPVRVRVEPPTQVVAGVSGVSLMTVRVRLEDQNGNVATSVHTGADLTAVGLTVQGKTGDTTVSINGIDGLAAYGFAADGITTGAVRVTNGTATFTFSNKKAETVTFAPVVYYRGQALPPVSSQGTTIPGPIHQLVTTPSQIVLNAAAGGTLTVRGSVADLYGNAIPLQGDSLRFSLDNTAFASLLGETSIRSDNGSASITIQGRVTGGGASNLTISSDRAGLPPLTVPVIADLPPTAPSTWATDNAGTDYTISAADLGVRVRVTVTPRLMDQRVVVQVNGVIIPLFSADLITQAVVTIPAGSSGPLDVYIRKQDLGYYGVKQIRATVESLLGLSPLSSPSDVTFTNQ